MAYQETEVQTPQDPEYEAFLAAMDDGDEEESPVVAEAEAEAEEEDEKAAKAHQAERSAVEELRAELKAKEIEETFEKSASDDEKHLLAIYRKGDESPAQLKKLMQLVHTKVQEAHKDPEEVEEEIESKAAEMAKESYGAGPISTKRQKVDEEAELIKVIERGGPESDKALARALFANDSVIGPYLND